MNRRGMTLDQLETIWTKQLKSSKRTSFWTRAWIGVIIFFGFGGALFDIILGIALMAAGQQNVSRPVSTVTGLLVLALGAYAGFLLIKVLVRVRSFIKLRTNLDSNGELFWMPTELETQKVSSLLTPIARSMKLDGRAYSFIKPKNSTANSPSVVEKPDGTILMIVPQDFLDLCDSKPNFATAMLAHELGHVRQQDTKLWLYATAFAEEQMRVFLPFYIGLAIFLSLEGLLLMALSNFSGDGILKGIQNIVSGAGAVYGLFFFYNRIRRYRRKSEELADLAAWIYADKDTGVLEECFRLPRHEAKPTQEDLLAAFGFFGEGIVGKWALKIHPDTKTRLEQVRRYSRLVHGETRKLKLTKYAGFIDYLVFYGPVAALLLSAMLYPVFTQAKEAAKKAACMSNVKQIDLSLMMYENDYDDQVPVIEVADWGESGPNRQTWAQLLQPYMKSTGILVCPNVPSGNPPASVGAEASDDPRYQKSSYLFNGIVAGNSDTSVPEPAITILFHESNIYQTATYAPIPVPGNTSMAYHIDSDHFDVNHSGNPGTSGNLGYMDGHAKSVPKSKIHYSVFGLSDQTRALSDDGPTANQTFGEQLPISADFLPQPTTSQ